MRICVILFTTNIIVFGVLAKTDCKVKLQQCENRRPPPHKPVCGTDNRTYPNRCELLRIQCTQNSPLTVKHKGKCKEKQPCWIDQGKKMTKTNGKNQKIMADDIPECLADGTYAPVQCNKSTGYCWCVTPNGKVIPRTSARHRRLECPKRGRENNSQDSGDEAGHSSRKGCDEINKNIFINNLVRIFKTEFSREIFRKQYSYIPTNLNVSTLEQNAIQWKFVTLDKDKNNSLNKNEYRDLRKLVKKVVKPRKCSRMFIRICDTDQSSVITKQEWTNCLNVSTNEEHYRRPVEETSSADTDTDTDTEDVDLVQPETDPATVLEESVLPLKDHTSENEKEHEGKVNDCLADRKAVLDELKLDEPRLAQMIKSGNQDMLYVPECLSDGRYNKVQCYHSTGYCWCVLEDSGKPIPGTSVKNSDPKCDNIQTLLRPMKGCPDHKKIALIKGLMNFFQHNVTSPSSSIDLNSKDNHKEHEQTASLGFQNLDLNKNQVLDKKEWKPIRSIMSTNKMLKRCGRKFPRYCDMNHDNKITMTEWIQCLNLQTITSLDIHSSLMSSRHGPNPESFLKEDD